MIISKIKVMASHGRQYIKDLEGAQVPPPFRGRPLLSPGLDDVTCNMLANLCPVGAIGTHPLSLDTGKCLFCGECARLSKGHIEFGNDHRIGAFGRDDLIYTADSQPALPSPDKVRSQIRDYFGHALKLREVCAGGDCSTDMELNASMNVNFDFSRFGIDFVASPRHADGIVITGPITNAMAVPLQMCYEAVAEPKVIILAGTDAISGGLFAGERTIDRSFLNNHTPDLWLPGNPVHPLTFIDGVLRLTGRNKKK